jgi:signal transduction histidine kinase
VSTQRWTPTTPLEGYRSAVGTTWGRRPGTEIAAAVTARAGDAIVLAFIAAAVLERIVLRHAGISVLLAATWGFPLLARRWAPVLAPSATLLLVAGSFVVHPGVGEHTAGELLLVGAAVWVLATAAPRPAAAVGLLGVAGVFAATVEPDGALDDSLALALLLTGTAVVGIVHRARRTDADRFAVEADEVERDREISLRAAASEERTRIARELHDIVAHSVSVATVQAGAARLQLDRDPARAAVALDTAERAVADAQAELERLVDLLGDEAVDGGRGLDDVPALFEQARATGLDLDVEVVGVAPELPPGLGLAVHRILQEALTNARRHVGPVPVEVSLHLLPTELRLRVTNPLVAEGGAVTGLEGYGAGNGTTGIRERAALYGGQAIIGPDGDRFVVDVRLPVS